MEFRCFVKNDDVIAVSQRDVTQCYPFLKEERQDILSDATAEWGDKFYIVLEVAGHTDDTGVRGMTVEQSRNYNWGLATKRANTVVKLTEDILRNDDALRESLKVHLGPDPSNKDTILRATGYCYSAPYAPILDSNGQKLKKPALTTARKQNRRVEIRLFAQPQPLVHRRAGDLSE